MRSNPQLGAPWLTPRLEARLRDLERTLIRRRTKIHGELHGEMVCETAPDMAIDLVRDHSGQEADLVFGTASFPGLSRRHWWIALDDGTIVDVASSQFGQRSPLVIPPGHPMQRFYVADEPPEREEGSGVCAECELHDHDACSEPDCACPCQRRQNPSTVESLRQSISEYGPKYAAKFMDFYPDSAFGRLRPHKTERLYKGEKVHWIGTPGRMLRVTPDFVKNLEGNVFDPKKLAAVSWFVRRSDEPVVMRPGYGQVMVTTDIDDITESLQYAKDAEIFGEDRTLSTDDEELDAYLKDPRTYLEDNLRYYDGSGSESDDEDVVRAGFRAAMEAMKAEAVREGWGDLGARRYTVLDGNHRSFGALLAGEPYIWIRLLENDYQDFKRGGRPDLKGVLE